MNECNATHFNKTWSIIKGALKSFQNKSTINAVLFNNVEVTDEFYVAQLFNELFTEVARKLEADIPASTIDPLSLISRVDTSVFLYPVSVEKFTNVNNKI